MVPHSFWSRWPRKDGFSFWSSYSGTWSKRAAFAFCDSSHDSGKRIWTVMHLLLLGACCFICWRPKHSRAKPTKNTAITAGGKYLLESYPNVCLQIKWLSSHPLCNLEWTSFGSGFFCNIFPNALGSIWARLFAQKGFQNATNYDWDRFPCGFWATAKLKTHAKASVVVASAHVRFDVYPPGYFGLVRTSHVGLVAAVIALVFVHP